MFTSGSRTHRRDHYILLCPACHCHIGYRDLTASTDDTLSRVPHAASSTHVAKYYPRQLIRQILLGECITRLKGLTFAYQGHEHSSHSSLT
jgi:hypothetical protein